MRVGDSKDILIERTLSTLRRLGDATSIALATEIETAWQRVPWSIGLVGTDIEARTRCIDALCGGELLDLLGRAPGCAAVRLRRGAVTRFRAMRSDGTKEVLAMPAPRLENSGEVEVGPSAIVEELRDDLARHQAEAERAEQALPRLVRQPPPRWAFWLWLVRWVLLMFAHDKLAARDAAAARLGAARRQLTGIEDDVVVISTSPHDTRQEFLERLRALSSGMLVGRGVREIVLEVEGALLPEGVEVVEVASATASNTDAVVTMAGEDLRVVGEGEVSLGELSGAVAMFPVLAADARSRRLARRGREHILAELARVEERLEQAEIGFRNRLARLQTLRLADPDRFIAEQLARVRPQIITSVNAVIEHASTHLGAELAQLAAVWAAAVDRVASAEELKAAAAQIDETSPVTLNRIADEVRLLVTGGIGGSVHDLHAGLVADLRAHGMSEADLRTPRNATVPPLDRLRTLTSIRARGIADELGGAGKWITGLFRSIKTRRAELLQIVAQHASQINESAMDELIEAEPSLHRALIGALSSALTDVVERQVAWLEGEIDKESDAIFRERQALAPQVKLSEDVRRAVLDLNELIAQRENEPLVPRARLQVG